MKYVVFILFMLPLAVNGQATLGAMSNQAFHGTIHVPSFMQLEVNTGNNNIGFNTFEEFFRGKEYPGYFNVKVKSTRPYIVTARSKMPHLQAKSAQGSMDVPSDIFSIKHNNTHQYVKLLTSSQPVILSTTNQLVKHYSLDMKIIGPPNARGGEYSTAVVFSITAQ